ncbi:hypothetical protein GCM10017044_05970 [Kordiimonas sediminis]|uniref:Uncharacterized protein n=1 Tax=Kordiimonas sediminis TaxID=1735581 RepID=A0A919E5M0_9PROT|nr:hypothetical protein GCM10017044_05970 [Kordiimonas sediminis]
MAKKRGTKLGNPNGANALRLTAKGNADALKVIQGGMRLHPEAEACDRGVKSTRCDDLKYHCGGPDGETHHDQKERQVAPGRC